jgi:hypothetical protein
MLTDKTKVEFEKWFEKENSNENETLLTIVSHYYGDDEVYYSDIFDKLPFSSKYGVYENFFISKGIYMDISYEAYEDGVNVLWQVFEYDRLSHDNWSDNSSGGYGDNGGYDLKTARTEAIKKANEILNKWKIG